MTDRIERLKKNREQRTIEIDKAVFITNQFLGTRERSSGAIISAKTFLSIIRIPIKILTLLKHPAF